MTEDQIRHMVDRFLSWKLPEDFSPGAGITYEQMFTGRDGWPEKREPFGKNLLGADQADDMVRHMLEGLPREETSAPAISIDTGHGAAEVTRTSQVRIRKTTRQRVTNDRFMDRLI